MKTTASPPLRTLVVGSRPLRFEKGWHVKTTLRDVFFTFPGLLLIVHTACGGGNTSPTPMTPSALTAVEAPVPTGVWPYAIADGPDGKYVYVVNLHLIDWAALGPSKAALKFFVRT